MRMLAAIVVSLRPRQWVKNLFVFAGLIFAQKLFTPAVWVALAAFVIFCGLSGAIYLFNDVADRERDRLDPRKRTRPIAAGRLPVGVAIGTGVVLVMGGLVLAALLSRPFFLTAFAYVILLIAYSAWLKHIVIVDAIVVAGGFVLRAVAGAVVIDVEMSGWLLTARSCWRSSWPSASGATSTWRSKRMRRAIARSSPSTARRCWTR